MTSVFMSTWGDPSSPKHILLIHGLTSSSQFWHRIAQDFASKGYFVTAPDLLGHGNARRGSVYTMAALAEELHPLFAAGHDHPYHAVIAHSLGGVVASALLPVLKSTRSIPVVLIDPPFAPSPERALHYRNMFIANVTNPITPEEFLLEYPTWSKEDAIFASLSLQLCDIAAVEAIFEQNVPWSFAHFLSNAPDNVKVTVLAADPSKFPCVREEEIEPYPHVTVATIWGASHLIPIELPELIIQTALQGIE